MNKKLRLGMVGGGKGAFIGALHRIATRLDNEYDLICGAFSSDAEKSKDSGQLLGLSPERSYLSYKELFEKESALPFEERMEVVSIVTPNHLHFEPAKMALLNGFHVILDKPITFSLAEAKELKQILAQSGKSLMLTHTYTGYPMVKEAKQLIANGHIGEIRKIYVEYPQGWLSQPLENSENKQAAWRTDPSKSGIAGAMGDIGTHAFNLAEYISGLTTSKICADINTVVENRRLDDDGAVLLKFNNGASGVLMATQIATGEENNVKIRIYGAKGGIVWQQEDNNSLQVKLLDQPTQTYRAGTGYLSEIATHNCRTPAGHPEGYLEAFANLYRNFALYLRASDKEREQQPAISDFPGIEDGLRGMAFIENVIESGKSDLKWTEFKV
ncbi:Gfo/Idh/MocA family protein [Pedobacter arcticus]|uniref:Gfo/Idh/MocA family protein n=1 Tax=Pedobacter arcticus TaxID=752140 RepID=UPI0002E4DB4F|nr:Gfo/Idh/MocA family oxidoreductase [Pedobacter arcticus]